MKILVSLVAVTVFLAILMSALPALTAENQYTEDFTTTLYRDAGNTTADWDTSTGELSLFPYDPTLVSSYNTPGTSLDIAVAGDYAFLVDDTSGLLIFDISDPAKPALIGSYNTPGNAYGVAVSGDYAFVADVNSGLQVINITNPASPTLLGTYNAMDSTFDVTVEGDYAFLAADGAGLEIVDISDPAHPTYLGNNGVPTFGHAYGVAVGGDYAFVVEYYAGLRVLDISDPTNPTNIAGCSTPGHTYAVAIAGDHAFLADGTYGLQIVDISDPANPSIIGRYDTGNAFDVEVSGNYAYVADRSRGFKVIDISDPANPTLLGSYNTTGDTWGITVAGGQAFLADGASGLQVFQIADAVAPEILGNYNAWSHVGQIKVSGDYAYVADFYSGLHVFDLTNPTDPILLDSHATPSNTYVVDVAGDYAYVADDVSGIQVFDISDPTNITLHGSYDTPFFALDITVSGDYAFVADYHAGFIALDISDPANPTLLGSLGTADDARAVAIAGNYGFVADMYAGLHVFNISDPTDLRLLGTCNTPGRAYDVKVSGDYAFVADYDYGLQIIDISSPISPTILGTWNSPGYALGVTVSGDFAFLADQNSGLHVIDISDPTNPTLLESRDTPGYCSKVTVAGDFAFMSDGSRGIQVIQVFKSGPNTDDNEARSLALDDSSEDIIRARMTTTQTDNVFWELSADGDLNWQGILPGTDWNKLDDPGNDLLWRSTLSLDETGNVPVVTDLEIEWLVEAPVINWILDVYGDDGGWVHMYFSRSGRDFLDESSYKITNYEIWRRVDIALANSLQGSASTQSPLDITTSTFPPGTWELVGPHPAGQLNHYSLLVPTVADSTASATNYSVFVVVARTATPSIFYVSEPDSCYSIDSIAPGVPTSISAAYLATGVVLDWDDAPESDVEFYHVYRDLDPGFVPSAGNLIMEIATSAWTDPANDPWAFHYKITALDLAGNESVAGSPGSVSGVDQGTLPTRTALLGAVPNPFNPSTKISFDLAVAGNVRLKVFDAAGRLVATLVDEHHDAGRVDVVWDGRDDAGRVASAGVYLYRLEAPRGFSETRRVVLIK